MIFVSRAAKMVFHLFGGEKRRNAGNDAPRPEDPQPGDDVFRDVGEVDAYDIALLEPLCEQHVGKSIGVAIQLGEGHLHPHEGEGRLGGESFEDGGNRIDIRLFPSGWVDVG
jgi:hypothetical protein